MCVYAVSSESAIVLRVAGQVGEVQEVAPLHYTPLQCLHSLHSLHLELSCLLHRPQAHLGGVGGGRSAQAALR